MLEASLGSEVRGDEQGALMCINGLILLICSRLLLVLFFGEHKSTKLVAVNFAI